MKIACPKCGREYRLDPSRIPAKGARFTCWGCQAKVEVRPLQAGQNEATVTESPSSKDLKEHKQTVDEAKATTSSPPPATSNQSDSKSEDEGFFTGPGIKKSTLNKTDSEPKREPASAAKTAPLLPSKLQTSPNPSVEAGLTGALVGAGLTGTLKAQPLKITCPKCQHVYRIDPSRIPGGGGKFTCRNCQARIEVRPNQKAEEKSPETVQKGTSRYQTPPISQPTIPNAGLVANVTDAKPATEEELNKPGPITGPFSFKPPTKEEEPKEETPSQSVFDGESTMVMGSPPSQIKKAMEEAQAKADEEASKKDFAFTDPSNEVKEPIKPPTFDFSDLSKPKEISFDLPTSPKEEKVETNFNFLDPKAEKLPEEPKEKFNFTDDSTPVAVGATRKDSAELPNTETASSDTKRDLTDPLDPLSEVNSTLAMTNADIASAIESRTKEKSEKAEKKLTIPTPPVFEFDLNLPETKPTSEISSGLSQASEDLNATVAVEAGKPSWQTDAEEKVETKKEQSDNIFDLKTVVSMPAPIPLTKQASEVDDNKTKQLSSTPTFKLEEKEQSSNPFTFTPAAVPPTLEKPGANLVKEPIKGEEKPPSASPFSLTKGEEEKKAEPKIPPPPSLKPKTEPPVVKEDKPAAEVPAFKPPKVDLPKTEPAKKDAKSDPPKAKADILNKPLKEEKKTEDLPVPVYNPDIFSPPPPVEEPENSGSALFRGLLIGSSVAVLGLIIYFAFFKTPTPVVTSSPTPTETQIVKNTPTVVQTPDKPITSPTPTTASPTPKASVSPTTSPTPKATASATPKITPTPKATDKPSTAGSLPDSLAGAGKYTVQVRATQSQGEAESIGKKLRSTGAEVYVVRADLGAKGIWYRVRVGRYQSFAEAQRAGAELKNKGNVAEFIATTY